MEKQTDVEFPQTAEVSTGVADRPLSEAVLSASNLLKVTVETAYSVPEAWIGPPPNTFTASLQVPITAEKDQVLLFPDGQLKVGEQMEVEDEDRPQFALLVPGTSFLAEPIELEDSEWTSLKITDSGIHKNPTIQNIIKDVGLQNEMETRKERVSWNIEKSCVVDAGGAARLRQRITECRLWPVEIMRSSSAQAKAPKGSKTSGKENHCMALVDLGPLLYPGVSHIRGAYTIQPFSESKLLDKSSSKTKTTYNETDPELLDSTDEKIYEEARTYIVIDVALEKPLVHKRSPEELATRVKELIPPRIQLPQHSIRALKAERAVLGFHNQVANVVEQVLEQFLELYATGANLQSCSPEEMRAELNGALNISGRYFAFKEQMKYSLVRLVRDKIQRTTPLTDPQELQSFISEFYIYLVEQMHEALNKILSDDQQEAQVQIQFSAPQLRLFAREAQLTGRYQQAAQYCQELVLQEPDEPSHWCQWGSLCMQIGDYLKAEECFHHAVSIQQTHQPSLLMCGILASLFKRYEEAQTFLERATSIKPAGVVAWMLLGLFHESQNDPFKASKAFLEASRQLMKEGMVRQSEMKAPTDQAKEEKEKDPQSSDEVSDTHEKSPVHKFTSDSDKISSIIYKETVQFLLQHSALQMAECALSHELLCSDSGRGASFLIRQAQLHLQRVDHCSVAATLEEAMFRNFQDADVWALNGHLHYLNGELGQARKSYERSLDFKPHPSDTHLIHLRIGSLYLQEQKFEQAKAVYLRACQHWPSCGTWLGLGIACYRLGEFGEAEDALTEANHLNKLNGEVWGYLCLICLKCGRQAEAVQTYRYATRLNLQESLLHEIKKLQGPAGSW